MVKNGERMQTKNTARQRTGNMNKPCKIRITERDLEILNFINDFGFCEMPQLEKRFNLRKPKNYMLINRLIKIGLVKHERLFYGRHGIYRLTRKGARNTPLPPLNRVVLGNYIHDIKLMEIYLKLRELYPEAQWISERKLKQEKYTDGVGKKGHLPDGMLIFPDGKEVAIEVELTAKDRRRVERILKWYTGKFDIKEVWYYCSPSIVAYMQNKAAKMAFVKVKRLDELLGKDKEAIPNAKTCKILEESEQGIGLKKCESVNDLFKQLGV